LYKFVSNKVKNYQNSTIYPVYYFCKKFENKPNYSIHHYNGSWIDGYSRKNMFKLGKKQIVRFHRRKNVENNNYPLLKNETIQNKLKIFDYEICLIKEI
jgi:hypothetical protein